VIGAQKGLVEESDLKIPNMRGIMMARQKTIEVVPAENIDARTTDVRFERPAAKGEVTLIEPNDLDTLIDLLHKEAKVL